MPSSAGKKIIERLAACPLCASCERLGLRFGRLPKCRTSELEFVPLDFSSLILFFFNDTATTEIYTLSLHDALPICGTPGRRPGPRSERHACRSRYAGTRSEEHTSELQSLRHLVCRLLLEKKKK